MAYINNASIFAKIAKSPRVQAAAYAVVKERVESAKEELIEEFDSHPVTEEIEAGPFIEKSNFLSYGNLFSFLGFEIGRNPTKVVRDLLETISVNRRPQTSYRYWLFKVNIPDIEKLENATPLDWESGRSWLSAVSKGLSGFSYYMFSISRGLIGRSGAGIQTKGRLRPGQWSGTPYVFEMLTKFKNKIKKLR